MREQHAEIFTETEAIHFLRMDSADEFRELCERFNFSGFELPSGARLFHREQLELIARLIFGIPMKSLPKLSGNEQAGRLPDSLCFLKKRLVRLDWCSAPIPCVYFLLCEGRVSYVGQSTDLLNRLLKHKVGGRTFDGIAYLPTEGADLDAVEGAMISRVRPFENIKAGSPLPAARRTLRRMGVAGGTW